MDEAVLCDNHGETAEHLGRILTEKVPAGHEASVCIAAADTLLEIAFENMNRVRPRGWWRERFLVRTHIHNRQMEVRC
jgi:hypothetical protein